MVVVVSGGLVYGVGWTPDILFFQRNEKVNNLRVQ